MTWWGRWSSVVTILNILRTSNVMNITTINCIVALKTVECIISLYRLRVWCVSGKSLILQHCLKHKIDLKFHILHAMSNRSGSMFGLKPLLIYAALLLTHTALSFLPWSDAINAEIFVSLSLNLLSLSLNVGCSTPCFPVFHATVLAWYPLSYTFKNSKTSSFLYISTKSPSWNSC